MITPPSRAGKRNKPGFFHPVRVEAATPTAPEEPS